EALKRVKEEGISRLLSGVEIDGPSLGSYNDGSMLEPFPVSQSGGEQIGEVTSACFSPRLERNIGLAMLPIDLAKTGTEVGVHTPTGPRAAQVGVKPVLDPSTATPNGSRGMDLAYE